MTAQYPNGTGTVKGEHRLQRSVGSRSTYGTAGTLLTCRAPSSAAGPSDSGAYASPCPDPSRTFGDRQADAAIDHAHDYTDPQHNHSGGQSGGNCDPGSQSQSAPSNTGAADTEIVVNGITRTTSTETYKGSIETDKVDSNETRPVNIAMLPIIKI